MEKFSLKWNDFQSNLTRSFSQLRQEEDFYDVTLVSDDNVHISSHKLVLSVSSEFFKDILRKSAHPNPMIYLSGINCKELYFVMEYIYNGEVEILEEDLKIFLEIAKKLKLDGLMNEQLINQYDQNPNDQTFPNIKEDEDEKPPTIFLSVEFMKKYKKYEKNHIKSLDVSTTNLDANEAVEQLIYRNGDIFECKTCGKTATRIGDIRKHVEVHIDGLSFKCNVCGIKFRSRMVLGNHKRNHKRRNYI